MLTNDPHANQEVLYRGKIKSAKSAMIMIHGRGADAESILIFSNILKTTGYIFAAPQAKENTWYPHSFLFPTKENEPGLSSGLNVIDRLIKKFNDFGIDNDEIIILGFSQGACLALEYAARNAKRYKGVIGLSGGLIGDIVEKNRYSGSFEKCPVFLGCSDNDSHIPEMRVHQTAALMERLNASVTKRIYPGMGHTINEDEINFIHSII